MESGTLGGVVKRVAQDATSPAVREGRISRTRSPGLFEVRVRSLLGDVRSVLVRGPMLELPRDAAVWIAEDEGGQLVLVSHAGDPLASVADHEARLDALEAATAGFYMRLEADVVGAFPNNTTSKVPMDTIVYQSHAGMVNLATDQATIPAGMGGWWVFDGGALQTAAFTANLTYQTFVIVTSASLVLDTYFPSLTSRKVLLGTRAMRVAAGETVHVAYFQNSGASYTADGLVGDFNYLRGVRVGP